MVKTVHTVKFYQTAKKFPSNCGQGLLLKVYAVSEKILIFFPRSAFVVWNEKGAFVPPRNNQKAEGIFWTAVSSFKKSVLPFLWRWESSHVVLTVSCISCKWQKVCKKGKGATMTTVDYIALKEKIGTILFSTDQKFACYVWHGKFYLFP